jgi:flagellar basal body-associated protein FliL
MTARQRTLEKKENKIKRKRSVIAQILIILLLIGIAVSAGIFFIMMINKGKKTAGQSFDKAMNMSYNSTGYSEN